MFFAIFHLPEPPGRYSPYKITDPKARSAYRLTFEQARIALVNSLELACEAFKPLMSLYEINLLVSECEFTFNILASLEMQKGDRQHVYDFQAEGVAKYTSYRNGQEARSRNFADWDTAVVHFLMGPCLIVKRQLLRDDLPPLQASVVRQTEAILCQELRRLGKNFDIVPVI